MLTIMDLPWTYVNGAEVAAINHFYAAERTSVPTCGKYITARVTGKDGESAIIVRVARNGSTHFEALQLLWDVFTKDTPTVTILGGGDIRCYFEGDGYAVCISGGSGRFGNDTNRDITLALIKKAVPRDVRVLCI